MRARILRTTIVVATLAMVVLAAAAVRPPTSQAAPVSCAASLNLFGNPGFETGNLSPWVALGTTPTPTVSTAQAHTGTYSALVGTPSGSEPNGDSSFYQQVTVPSGASQLSFWYWPSTTDTVTFDWQEVDVTNTSGTVLATVFHQAINTQTWTNQTFDMTPFVGQTVRLQFLVHQDGFGDPTAMYVDDVCLSPTPRTLAVAKAGSGSGSVSSSPAGINCGPTCSAQFADGSTVSLSAAPAVGSRFAGWSGGGCSGTGTCTVPMNADKSVTASFVQVHTLRVTKTGSGVGLVSSNPAGISCGGTCSAQYDKGTSVTLAAVPATGSRFAGWSGGGCSGTGTCTLAMNAELAANAKFVATPPNTRIRKARINQKKHTATFRFKAVGRAKGFQCALLKKGKRHTQKPRFKRCKSPKTYKHLKSGRYTFEVRAVGPGGHDPTPAKKKFTIR